MAQTDKEFLIRVKADIEKAVSDMRKLSGEIDKTGSESRRAASGTRAMGTSLRGLAAAAGAYLTVATALKALRMADDWKQLQQRIRLATKETGDYNKVSRELYAIAQQNGAAMADTVATFQRLSLARQELDATNDEIVKVTNAVQQLGIMSGASTQGMQAGMLQFAQAMSAGTVRAEEMNSILENMPAVADRIARGMGMTVGELRAAVLEGNVLSRDVFDALLSQTTDIAAEMEGFPVTMDRAWTIAVDSSARFLSNLKEVSAVGALVTQSLEGWAEMLNAYSEGIESENLLSVKTKERIRLMERRNELEEELGVIEAKIWDGRGARDYGSIEKAIKYADVLKGKLEVVNKKLETLAKPTGDGSGGSDGDGSGGSDGDGSGGSDRDGSGRGRSQSNPIAERIKALEMEAATYGMTAAEVALYRLELEGASQAQLDRARTALESIEADQSFADAVLASAAAVKAENAEMAAFEAAQQQYLEAVIASVDPTYELVKELQRLEALMARFPAHAVVIGEAMDKVRNKIDKLKTGSRETTEEMSQFAVQAARNIQDAFADFLFDPFGQGLDGMALSFTNTLRRMAAEALSQQLLKSLFSGLSGLGGGLGNFFGGFSAGVAHTGGMAGSVPTRQVSPWLFAGAQRLHSGGIAGLAPTEVPTILQRGEEILPRSDPRHAANSGGSQQNLRVILVDDRANIGDYLASSEGDKSFVQAIQRNAMSVRNIIGA